MGLKTFYTIIDNFLVIALKPSQEPPASNVPPGFYFNYGFFQGQVTLPGTGVVVPEGNAVHSSGMVCPNSRALEAEGVPSGSSVSVNPDFPLSGQASVEIEYGVSISPAEAVAGVPPSNSPTVVPEGVGAPAITDTYPPGNRAQLSGYNTRLNITFFEHLFPNPGKTFIRIPEKGTILIISSAYKGIHFPHEKNPSEVKSQVNFPKDSKIYLLWQDDFHPVKHNNMRFTTEPYDLKKDLKSNSKLFSKKLFLYYCEFPDIGSIALTKTGPDNNFELKINGNGAKLNKYTEFTKIIDPERRGPKN